uniref:Transcription initiation factor IIF subunit alpha n=1 Tax=Parascaris univalens TaxID=6257 RepID=A0A915AK06_PARUN
MANQAKQSQYVVHIPKPNRHKRYSILKFSKSLMVDPGRWTTQDSVHMSREDNRAQAAATEIKQDYGAGTEYGSAAREEARRKKYGHQTRRYQVDSQPWRLTVEDQSGKERKFRSIREGGAGEHADYWIFMKSGGEFHAHKVDDWYQFLPCIQHPVLDIDQAEERFQQRNQVMNQFALKAQIRRQLNAMNEDGEQIVKTAKMLKIKDEASSDEDESEGEKGDGEDSRGSKKAQKKKNRPPRKDKKQRVENADEVAAYESEDGEDEGREYDYMSDSGSDTDRDDIPMEQKVDEALVAVGDEEGLKKMIESDLSDTESSEDDDDTTKKLLAATEGIDEENKKRFTDIEERDSSGSDSDDPDKEPASAFLLSMKKTTDETSTNGKKRHHEDMNGGSSDTKRAKTEPSTEEGDSASPSGPSAQVVQQLPDGLNEETVRRYLRRKPHTTKELLSKIKSKCGDMEKSEIVQKLAAILKRIEPHQFKQKHGKKEVLFFSLSNNTT